MSTNAKPKKIQRYTIDEKLSYRIDFLRVVAMAMIVLIHSYNAEIHIPGAAALEAPAWLNFFRNTMHQVITRPAIPLFFLLSGLLLYSKEFTWADNMKRKLRTILVPYLIWNTLWIIFYFVAQAIPQTAGYFTGSDIIIREWDFARWVDAYTAFRSPWPFLYTFWFLKDLFILNLLATVIKWLIDKVPLVCFTGLCVLLFCNIPLPIIETSSLVFFALGYYIVKYKARIQRIDQFDIRILLVVYAATVVWDVMHIGNVIAHNACILAGMVLLIRLSFYGVASERGKKFYHYVAGYVFFIYAFHEMTLTIFKKLFAKLLPQTAFVQLCEYIGIALFVMALSVGIGALLYRGLPQLYAWMTGERTPDRRISDLK